MTSSINPDDSFAALLSLSLQWHTKEGVEKWPRSRSWQLYVVYTPAFLRGLHDHGLCGEDTFEARLQRVGFVRTVWRVNGCGAYMDKPCGSCGCFGSTDSMYLIQMKRDKTELWLAGTYFEYDQHNDKLTKFNSKNHYFHPFTRYVYNTTCWYHLYFKFN